MTEYEEEIFSKCPLCEQPIDYCQGHSQLELSDNPWDLFKELYGLYNAPFVVEFSIIERETKLRELLADAFGVDTDLVYLEQANAPWGSAQLDFRHCESDEVLGSMRIQVPQASENPLDPDGYALRQAECEICGEDVKPHEEIAEMYYPNDPSQGSLICHAQCGINNGMEIA